MSCIRPATPGFLVTLVATVLLAVVSFCVPYFESVFFLKATITVDNINGNITFGTLGYCLELANGTTCSKPSIGYELDINSLVGNKLPVEIPQVAVKWLTYALFLHVIALIGAAISAFFGLMAHVREMSMACCSTFISGFAAVVAMFAFIFDIVLFFVAKARINAVGSAQIGNAMLHIKPTESAWQIWWKLWGRDPEAVPGPNKDYAADQLRLDAVKAEADRKARQKTEVGLPVFGSETQPLTARIEGDQVYIDGDDGANHANLPASAPLPARQHAGYMQGVPGTRAVDDYYNPQPQTPQTTGNTYPPQRQPSACCWIHAYNTPLTTSPPPSNQLLAIPGQYGHTAGGTSYHTAASYHEQQPTNYSQYDPYAPQSHYAEPSYNADPYNNTTTGYTATHDPYYHSTSPPPPQQNQRQYTLGGDGYGANSVPPLQQDYVNHPNGHGASSVPPLQDYHDRSGVQYGAPAPSGIDTNVGYAFSPQPQTNPVRGPRAQPGTIPEEAPPPSYEPSTSGVTGNWGKR
ncbi:SUR7/PalI family-domain-containing protein [Gymnopilus junonius]|uniref:SUR7/PalI family-domain-containing protein n=1 Tax=Gymnopilus junonius TaxID=109634 RepID=A0A9P5NVG6_GYMJU|nr:SUR7/PalI family-domain-containing protein [Gymnopilus junonius]